MLALQSQRKAPLGRGWVAYRRAALAWRLATPPNGEFARRLNKSKIPFGTKENIAETSTQGHPTTLSS